MVLCKLKRSSAAQVIGVDDLVGFEFMDPPPKQLLSKALEELHLLGAIDKSMTLTELGRRMSMLPLEPQYAKLLLSSADFGCSEEVCFLHIFVSIRVKCTPPILSLRAAVFSQNLLDVNILTAIMRHRVRRSSPSWQCCLSSRSFSPRQTLAKTRRGQGAT